MKRQIEALVKSLGKFLLPEEVVHEYRNQLISVEDSVLIIVLDSCRYDVFREVYDDQFPASEVKRAFSPADWTVPSHESIARGQIPAGDFDNPINSITDYSKGVPLAGQHESSFAVAAMPWLSDSSAVSNNFHTYFDDFYCAEDPDSCDEVLGKAREFVDGNKNFFGVINFGETHSPFDHSRPENTQEVFEGIRNGKWSAEEVKGWQADSAEMLIEEIDDFRECLPKDTLVIVTADHGEMFGEDGGLGHDTLKDAHFHDKLFEVPFLSWRE